MYSGSIIDDLMASVRRAEIVAALRKPEDSLQSGMPMSVSISNTHSAWSEFEVQGENNGSEVWPWQ